MANSDTKTQSWHADRIVLIQFRGFSANRKLSGFHGEISPPKSASRHQIAQLPLSALLRTDIVALLLS
jgi:hypothetical protein